MAGSHAPRIVSILPAATETVFALGAGDQLVGVSHECDHPPAASRLPRVSRPRIDPTGSSAEIDRQVKAIKRDGKSLYELDRDLLADLRPDLILTQVLCDVCAVTPKDVEAAIADLPERPKIVALKSQSLEDVLDDIRTIGRVLDRNEETKLLLFRLWRTTKEIRKQVESLEAPRVAVLDWVDPLMFAGNWIPELCGIANAEYGLVKPGEPSRWGSWEELEEYEPDVVLAAPCGRAIADTQRELASAIPKGAQADLEAFSQGRVFIADGHEFFNRPGPRLIYSAALMARAFHGDIVPPLPAALESHLRRFRNGA